MADPDDIELVGFRGRQEPEPQFYTHASHGIVAPPKPPEPGTFADRMARSVERNVRDFCGIEEGAAEEEEKWQGRANRMSSNYIVQSKSRRMRPKSLDQDEVDAPLLLSELSKQELLNKQAEAVELISDSPHKKHYQPTDPIKTYKISRRLDPRRKQPRKKLEKPLLLTMAYEGLLNLFRPPKKSVQYHPTVNSRSFAPADLTRYGRPDDVLKQHVIQSAQDGRVNEDEVDAGLPMRGNIDDLFFGSGASTSSYAPAPLTPESPDQAGFPAGDADGTALLDYDEVDNRAQRPLEMIPPTKFREYNPHYRWVQKGGWLYREPITEAAVHAHTQKAKQIQQEPEVEEGFMTRISNNIKTSLFDNADRWDAARNKVLLWFDKGLFGKCLGVELDRYYKYKWQGDEYVADQSDDHRPGFTLWLTFIQIVICITSMAVYGIAPIGYDVHEVTQLIIKPTLALEKEVYLERENLWIGPRQADLVHLGAKYSPCMRQDQNVEAALMLDRIRENNTACCINNDDSGCVQTPRSKCSQTLATWYKWTASEPVMRDILRTSGSVCGQDPKFCRNPSSLGAFVWPDDITLWPVCTDTVNASSADENRHMTCEMLGRPCCVGIQGECLITTREHCTFLRGYFHEEATLCSQIDCMNEVCGMLPFAHFDEPDQFYRLWTSLFLHAGILHLFVTLVFNFLILWPVERLTGWIRTSVVYLASGMAGSLSSSIFLPYHVEAGPAGAQFGIIACHLVSIILFMQEPKWPIIKLMGIMLCLLFLGLLPMIDNYAHLFGFVFGFLVSFAILPFARFNKGDINQKTQRLIAIGICTVLAMTIAMILVILFYVAPIYNCPYCHYFNCIPLTNTFCETMEVKIRTTSTY